MPCEFGFNKASLSSIGASMQGKKEVEGYGTLILDEMKERQAVAFNKTYKVDGFLDYGDDEESVVPADHALVLMFVPLFHSCVQPIASFATRHASLGGWWQGWFWRRFCSFTNKMSLQLRSSVMVPQPTKPCNQLLA